MNINISTILVPMTSRDLGELFDLFSLMERPGSTPVKRRFVVSFDLGLSDEIRQQITGEFSNSKMPNWFDLHFIDCKMSPDESFYIRKFPKGFDFEAHPYGMKSGPNILFFRTLRIGKEISSGEGAALVLETDVTPLVDGWLQKIEQELLGAPEFLVAGPTYTGASALPKDIASHINGASVYNWSHPEFARYLQLWDCMVRLCCRHAPWQAYDTVSEWITHNGHWQVLKDKAGDIAEFQSMYQRYARRISSIANLAGPAEREAPDQLPVVLYFGKASIHLRAPLAVRRSWKNLSQGQSPQARVEDVAVDRDWQYPAITERHAFEKLRKGFVIRDSLYFAFPWATLIDRYLHKPDSVDDLLAELKRRVPVLRKYRVVVTVCQHVHMREFLDLMANIGITDVFWSHTTKSDVRNRGEYQIRLHPFPLFPVQATTLNPDDEWSSGVGRELLFSFIGSYAPPTYLSQSRNHIIDFLKTHPLGKVIERREWHYNNAVYAHQIKGAVDKDQQLIDESKSNEFREYLQKSTFSLCPSGSGPNSIRLWESIGSGSIPVILADTWAPPGNQRLWDMATVSCPETAKAIKALPDRLAEIAGNAVRLAQMRMAMRQLWMLYGPQNFVNDVQEFLLGHATAQSGRVVAPKANFVAPTSIPDGPNPARQMLLAWSSRLLLDPVAAIADIDAGAGLNLALDKALSLVAKTDLPEHFHSVLEHARRRSSSALPRAAVVASGKGPRIALLGKHSLRTPLSYEPIRRLVGDRVELVADPAGADLVLTGFNIDWRENVEVLRPLLALAKAPKLAVMSEEPLWDVTWSGPFTGREGKVTAKDTEIRYTFLGHETSDIYRFHRLPYFVLTDDRYPVRYATMMGRFGGMAPAELHKRWQATRITIAFFAEKREGQVFAGAFPERDVALLSGYRSTVAALSQGPGVLRIGSGWGANVKRQDLPDWHLDKLAQLDGDVRMATAYENVHQHNYISEKIFDAFAVGGVPVYWAGPKHRIFELVPETAMLNTVNLEPAAAAERIAGFKPDLELAERWLESCARLAGLFGDIQTVTTERQRVADAVVKEVLQMV